MNELDDYINKVKHLPPAPRVLLQLLTLLNQPDIDSSRVVNLITYDASLTVSVLAACNSAFFASASPTTDLQEAVARLGFRELFRLVAAVSGSRALTPAQKGYGIAEGELWRHSVTTAVAAQLIARDLGDDENLVFTAALLHDIGKIVLSQALEQNYAKLLDEVFQQQHSMFEAEKKVLGVQHAEIGGHLLARWKFPANLVAAVWFHHQPAAAAPHQRLASHIYLGNMIAYFMGHGYGHAAFALRGRAEALDILKLSSDSLPGYMIRTHEAGEALINIRS